MKSLRSVLFALILLPLSSALLNAAVDVNVYDDAVYLYLDKLYAGGLLETYMPNQRPISRSAIARLVEEARRNVRQGDPLESVIEELGREFADALSEKRVDLVPIERFELSYIATDQKESPVPDQGVGWTAGRVQPLLSDSKGDHIEGNGNVYASSVHRIRATPHVAAYLQPRYFVRSGDDSTGGVGLYRGYVKAGNDHVEVEAGRDDLRWGPGENSLLFSGNARPLDMLKVSSPKPFRLPGFLRYMGHFNATAFFSLLGNDYRPNGATLSGYRMDYSPFGWWNVGFDHAVFLGGEGATDPDFGTAVRSFLGFLSSSTNDRASSNHLIGVDSTFRIRRAMGMELYGKLLFEDTQAERGFMLRNDSSWLGGIYFPKFGGLERLSARGEFIYTGQFPYTHWFYRDGFSLDRKFMGYDAGPDTYSGSVSSKYQFNLDEFVKVEVRYLRRSSDHYRAIYSPSGNNIGIVRDVDGPEEKHSLVKVGGQKRVSKTIAIFGELGYDRKRNADFVNGRSANDISFKAGVVLHRSR